MGAMRSAAAIVAAVAVAAGPAAAEEARLNRAGYELKFITNDRYEGLLYGARAVRYVLPGTYVGLMGYGNLPAIGTEVAPAFGTLGLLAGYEGYLPYRLSYDLNLHVGVTRDLSDCSPSPLRNHLSVEPTVAIGVPIPPLPFLGAPRISLCVGYVCLPLALWASGPTIGLRWETKSLTQAVAD